jgi:hypothetical protein
VLNDFFSTAAFGRLCPFRRQDYKITRSTSYYYTPVKTGRHEIQNNLSALQNKNENCASYQMNFLYVFAFDSFFTFGGADDDGYQSGCCA